MKKPSIGRYLTADNIILCIGAFFLLLYLITEVSLRFLPTLSINALLRMVALLLICVILYCGGALRLRRTGDRKLLRGLFYLFAILYLYLLLSFTLFDTTLGRNGDFLYNNVKMDDRRAHYIKWFVNLIPFRSIYEVYILGFVRGYVSAYYMLLNLLGNICAFMPLAFFLPLLLRSQRKWYVFVPTVLLSVVLIETLQFLFMVGSCDIDDLILNAGGAVAFYFLLRIPPIKRLCERLLYGCFS